MGDRLLSKTVAIGTGTAGTTIISAVTAGTVIVTALQVGNIHASAAATFDKSLDAAGSGDVWSVKNTPVANGEAIVQYSSSSGALYLDGTGTLDTLKMTADAANKLVAELSYIERTP